MMSWESNPYCGVSSPGNEGVGESAAPHLGRDRDEPVHFTSGNEGTKAALIRFALGFCAVTLLFSPVLKELAYYAANSELYSHILLVPLISGYFVWLRRDAIKETKLEASIPFGIGAVFLGFGGVMIYAVIVTLGGTLGTEDSLSLLVSSYCVLIIAIALLTVGKSLLRKLMFPALFLFFLVPLPSVIRDLVEVKLQYASAFVTGFLFSMTGIPVVSEGIHFQLPGLNIEVARECSGIRSTFVLAIACVIAGNRLLKRGSHRVLLICCAVPIGILRNSLRIYLIAVLTSFVDSGIIDGPLHNQGGPAFLAVSLLPVFGIVALMRWRERPVAANIS